jgi:hypothetical protein
MVAARCGRNPAAPDLGFQESWFAMRFFFSWERLSSRDDRGWKAAPTTTTLSYRKNGLARGDLLPTDFNQVTFR